MGTTMWRIALRLLLGFCFALAAISKLQSDARDDNLFNRYTAAHPVLRNGIIGAEFAIGALFLLGLAIPAASVAAVVLCSAFAGVLITELTHPSPVPCGCFGRLSLAQGASVHARLYASLMLDVFLASCTIVLYLTYTRRKLDAG